MAGFGGLLRGEVGDPNPDLAGGGVGAGSFEEVTEVLGAQIKHGT